ncbi:MAG: hypothetical protein IPI11_11890 [Haliscomenobacter sp.]|nr:hypothetical protein [Haliscomenobacter sp.]
MLIRLKADRLAKNVYLDFPEAEGFFSDNYFDLLPGETVEVGFTPKQPATLTAESLKVVVMR